MSILNEDEIPKEKPGFFSLQRNGRSNSTIVLWMEWDVFAVCCPFHVLLLIKPCLVIVKEAGFPQIVSHLHSVLLKSLGRF